MTKRFTALCLPCLFLLGTTLARAESPQTADQKRDRSRWAEPQKGFWNEIQQKLESWHQAQEKKRPHRRLEMDMEGQNFPTDPALYQQLWHNPVESQGVTNTCWSFSTVSMLESDIQRMSGLKIKLSQIFIVYHEYLAKARSFVETRGKTYIGEGSEGNAVIRIIREQGIMPYEIFNGLKPEQPFHDHSRLFEEFHAYLEGVKARQAWDPHAVEQNVKAMLGHYLGTPPATFTWKGKSMTPKAFAKAIKLDPDAYVDILSYLQHPYWQRVPYDVPDNWWHDDSYHNVPLDVFMDTLKQALKAGYSVSLGGDVSEPGYQSRAEVGIVPTFDIPAAYIDEHARQFRFSNGITTDDHGVHLVGYHQTGDGTWWFMIKDSGSGAQDGPHKGYRFIREEYMRLKFMDFMVHRSAVEPLLKRFGKQ